MFLSKSEPIIRKVLYTVFLLLLVWGFLYTFVLGGTDKKSQELTDISPQGPQVCFDRGCYTVEIADTDEERRTGLMHVTQLADDAGMLFVYPNMRTKMGFWMKNTLIPLDIIWLDSEGKIVYMSGDVPPCEEDVCPTYVPSSNGHDMDIASQYVVELNAGEIERLDLYIGDTVVLPSNLHDIN